MPPATHRPPGEEGRLPSERGLPALGERPRLLRPAVLTGTDAAAAVRVATTAVRWIEEVECGRRPAAHLRTLLRPGLAERWTLVARLPRRPGRVCSAGRLQIQRFGPEPRCDLVVLVAHGDRVLPTGLRLVASAGRWTVTDLARPGGMPLPTAPAAWEALLDGS